MSEEYSKLKYRKLYTKGLGTVTHSQTKNF